MSQQTQRRWCVTLLTDDLSSLCLQCISCLSALLFKGVLM